MKLNRIFSFCVASVMFLMASCDDEDKEIAPEPVLQSCSLTKATEGQEITNLTYTGDKLTSFSVGAETVTLEYNSAGKPSKLTYSGSQDEVTYAYDAQGKLTSMSEAEQVEGGVSILTTQYQYTNNQITKATYTRTFQPTSGPSTIPLPRGYTTYTYDAKGNILTVQEYTSQNSLLSTTEKSSYDDKANPAAFLESLFEPASPHNPGTEVEKDEDGSIVKEASYTNVYTYNGSGYPTKVEKTNQNGVKTTTTFDYNCK